MRLVSEIRDNSMNNEMTYHGAFQGAKVVCCTLPSVSLHLEESADIHQT